MTRAIKTTFLLLIAALMTAALLALMNGLTPAEIAFAIALALFAAFVLINSI